MTDAVSTIYDITQDSILRQEIRARDERIAVENRLKNEAAEAKAETAEMKKCLRFFTVSQVTKVFFLTNAYHIFS